MAGGGPLIKKENGDQVPALSLKTVDMRGQNPKESLQETLPENSPLMVVRGDYFNSEKQGRLQEM